MDLNTKCSTILNVVFGKSTHKAPLGMEKYFNQSTPPDSFCFLFCSWRCEFSVWRSDMEKNTIEHFRKITMNWFHWKSVNQSAFDIRSNSVNIPSNYENGFYLITTALCIRLNYYTVFNSRIDVKTYFLLCVFICSNELYKLAKGNFVNKLMSYLQWLIY